MGQINSSRSTAAYKQLTYKVFSGAGLQHQRQ